MTLRERRKTQRLTQKQVADALSVHQSAVHLWETGKTKPRRKGHREKLAELYNCSVEELGED